MSAISSAIFGLPPALVFVHRFFDRAGSGEAPERSALWILAKPVRVLRDRYKPLLLPNLAQRILTPLLRSALLQPTGCLIHARARRSQPRGQSLRTRFFRNPAQLGVLRGFAASFPPGSGFRLAVIGCSTGAEVYSALQVVRSARPDLRVKVQAVDIEPAAIDCARKAQFAPTAPELDRVPARLLGSVLERSETGWEIRPALRDGICWQVADARSPELVSSLGQHDAVLANNFLVHMGGDEAEACITNLAGLVRAGGWLVLAGVDLDVRTAATHRLGLQPISLDVEAIHDSDEMLRAGWPWCYWGLEPLDKSRPDWRRRDTSVFTVPTQDGIRTDASAAHQGIEG